MCSFLGLRNQPVALQPEFRMHRLTIMASLMSLSAVPAFAQQFVDETAKRFPVQAEYSNQISICDIDLDGDLDIVFADGQGYSSIGVSLPPSIYINDGNGFFTNETEARMDGTLGWWRGVEFGDIDGDGDPDMLLANDFNRLGALLLNDGEGHFTRDLSLWPSERLSSARGQFADVDNDGDLDIAVCDSGTSSRFGSNGRPHIMLNDGTGNFIKVTETNTPNAIIPDQQDCIFADIDGDFDLDLHISSRSSSNGGSQIWVNDGNGVFTRLTSGVPTDYNTYSYDFGDFDGDGDLDLLGANAWTSNREMLLRNDDDGTTWTNLSDDISPNPTSDDNDTKFIDFDLDGDLDFVVAALGASQERFYRNNGNNTFTQMTNMATSFTDSSLDVEFADLDGDGRYDMVTAQGEFGNFQNRIYMNTGGRDAIPPRVVSTEQIEPEDGETGGFVVRTMVLDEHTSDRGFHAKGMDLVYVVDSGLEQSVEMIWSGNSLWRGVLPEVGPCRQVSYFVRATDGASNVGEGEVRNFETNGQCGSAADLNGDGRVDGEDIGLFLLQWGGPGSADFNGDGLVDGADFGILLLEGTF